MSPLKLWLIIPLAVSAPAHAQGTMEQGVTTRGATTQSQGVIVRQRTPVATQPSNDPFHNPIGQGVPPAASANSNQNSNRINVPIR
jgi:hypothetical protein